MLKVVFRSTMLDSELLEHIVKVHHELLTRVGLKADCTKSVGGFFSMDEANRANRRFLLNCG
jgi:hypothetical protein